MDIKVKDIAPANQTTPVKAQEKSDDSFKFTLISNIEEKDLQEKLGNMLFSIEFTEFIIRFKRSYNQIPVTTVKVNLSVISCKILPHTIHSIIFSQFNNPAALLHLNSCLIIYKKILNPIGLPGSHWSCCIQYNSIKLQTFIFN